MATFVNAVKNLRNGEATKRPSMRGYLMRTINDESLDLEIIKQGGHKLVFVKNDGTQIEFGMGGVARTDAILPVDNELLEGLLADDWETAKIDAFEKNRVGGNW